MLFRSVCQEASCGVGRNGGKHRSRCLIYQPLAALPHGGAYFMHTYSVVVVWCSWTRLFQRCLKIPGWAPDWEIFAREQSDPEFHRHDQPIDQSKHGRTYKARTFTIKSSVGCNLSYYVMFSEVL